MKKAQTKEEMKDYNTRKEYSIDGNNYFEYTEAVEVKDNGIFYARLVDTETGNILLKSQENIDNIIYEWEVWSCKEGIGYEKR